MLVDRSIKGGGEEKEIKVVEVGGVVIGKDRSSGRVTIQLQSRGDGWNGVVVVDAGAGL